MRAGTENETRLLAELIERGHLIPSGVAGLYGRGMSFEDVAERLGGLISALGAAEQPETPRFPPVMPRRTLEQAGYLKSFPQLCGAVFGFGGRETQALELAERAGRGEDWSGHLAMTDVVMVPAACYPAYPAIAARRPLAPGGLTLDLGGSYVFRNEPSGDPARMQMFRQRELVRMGEAETVLAWRETWIERARRLFQCLALDAVVDTASDPFFGRGGKLLAASQREHKFKFEVLIPIASPGPTAVASFNFHQDHFGSVFGIRMEDGAVANTACLGFGVERVTIALFHAHGMDPEQWPAAVRRHLWPRA